MLFVPERRRSRRLPSANRAERALASEAIEQGLLEAAYAWRCRLQPTE